MKDVQFYYTTPQELSSGAKAGELDQLAELLLKLGGAITKADPLTSVSGGVYSGYHVDGTGLQTELLMMLSINSTDSTFDAVARKVIEVAGVPAFAGVKYLEYVYPHFSAINEVLEYFGKQIESENHKSDQLYKVVNKI